MTINDIYTMIITSIGSVAGSAASDIIILSVSIMACTISLLVLHRNHKKMRGMHEKLHRLEHDLRIANGSAIGMGQQLIALEKEFKQQPSKIDIETNLPKENKQRPVQALSTSYEQSVDNSSAYDQARSQLAQGHDINQVAKSCGLSYAEVSLLQALSKQAVPSS